MCFAGDRVVSREGAAETRQGKPQPGDGVEHRERDEPECDTSIAVSEPTGDQDHANGYPPDEHALEHRAQRMSGTNGGECEDLSTEEAR